MKKMLVTLMAVLMAAGAGYSALLLSSGFETDTVGATPASLAVNGGASYTPNNAAWTAVNSFKTVNSSVNTAGTGNGVQFVDTSAVATKADFALSAAASAVKVSFAFSPVAVSGTGANYMNVALTAGTAFSSGTGANRYNELRLRDDGSIRFDFTTGSVVKTNTVGQSSTITMFVNDGSSAITYLALDGSGYKTLAADSVAYWMDNVFVNSGVLLAASAGTTNGLAALGFSSTTTRTGINYVFDNITVESIPEPATIGMVMLGALAIFGIRRYKG